MGQNRVRYGKYIFKNTATIYNVNVIKSFLTCACIRQWKGNLSHERDSGEINCTQAREQIEDREN